MKATIASQKEIESISGSINLITLHTPIYQLLNKLWTALSLQHNKNLKNNRIIGDGLGIIQE